MPQELNQVIAAGVIFLMIFIVLRFFKFLFSLSFIGFILSLVSYSVYEFKFYTVPVIAVVSFVLSICGFSKSSVIGKVFALCGVLISGYIILRNYGILS